MKELGRRKNAGSFRLKSGVWPKRKDGSEEGSRNAGGGREKWRERRWKGEKEGEWKGGKGCVALAEA